MGAAYLLFIFQRFIQLRKVLRGMPCSLEARYTLPPHLTAISAAHRLSFVYCRYGRTFGGQLENTARVNKQIVHKICLPDAA